MQLHQIEADIGRDRSAGRWRARTLDLDLLAYNDVVMPSLEVQLNWMQLPPEQQQEQAPDQLILPHPRLHQRGFVLVPLAEIASHWSHPVTGQTVGQMLDKLTATDLAGISPYFGATPLTNCL